MNRTSFITHHRAALAGVLCVALLCCFSGVYAADDQPSAPLPEVAASTPPAEPAAAAPAAAPAATDGVQPTIAENFSSVPADTAGLVASAPPADPCPLPEGVNSSGMADLAKIQEDIDRYTLCIQRAELLQQLAEAEQKNKDSFDTSLGLQDPKDPNTASNGVVGDVAPPPAPTNVAPISESDLGGMGTAAVASSRSDWEIDSVSGGRTSLSAVLIAPDNTRMRVKVGSKLPNDAGTVVSVSPSDVSVSKGKKTRSLSWAQINAKAAAKPTDGM